MITIQDQVYAHSCGCIVNATLHICGICGVFVNNRTMHTRAKPFMFVSLHPNAVVTIVPEWGHLLSSN